MEVLLYDLPQAPQSHPQLNCVFGPGHDWTRRSSDWDEPLEVFRLIVTPVFRAMFVIRKQLVAAYECISGPEAVPRVAVVCCRRVSSPLAEGLPGFRVARSPRHEHQLSRARSNYRHLVQRPIDRHVDATTSCEHHMAHPQCPSIPTQIWRQETPPTVSVHSMHAVSQCTRFP
jgi:hypothetical protein